jgi:adenylate cyclase
MFKRAVIIDRNYAEAYTGLADAASMLAFHYDVPPSVLESAIADSHRALSINPGLAEAHCSLGLAYSLSSQTDAAEAEFRTAIELEPRLQEAHFYRGFMRLLLIGRPDLAIDSLRVAFDLANQDLQTGLLLINCLRGLDKPGDLRAVGRHVFKVAQRRLNLNPYDDRAVYMGALALHELGEADEAMRWAKVAAAFDVQDGRTSYILSCLFALLGQADESLALLRKAIELGCSQAKIPWMRLHDRALTSVRQDPRFKALFAAFSEARNIS